VLKLSIEEIEDLDAKADIWYQEEHDSLSYKSAIKMARTALNSNIDTKITMI
jgi:hypothetical protein